jgi:hypothetical protein
MAKTNIESATTTNMTNAVTDFSVASGNDTGNEENYRCNWVKWLGFYEQIPEIAALIDKKALWTIGKGYITNKTTENILQSIKGNGKETFNSILYKAVKTYTLCGDYFAEIIKKNGKLYNLKTLNPGTIEILTDKKGYIRQYIQRNNNGVDVAKWNPNEIFHLSWNQKGDNTHGTSTIEKLTSEIPGKLGIIEMRNEALQDLRLVFHRYVKPLLITKVDTDDEAEIANFKSKLDSAVANGENIILPDETVKTMERVSIPQYATLDPLPWIKYLEQSFIMAEGIPEIIFGIGGNTTEASAKILYLAFQQMIEWNQLFLEENIKSQLGLDIELNFPADLMESLQSDERKDGKTAFQKNELNPMKVVR